MKSIKLFFVIAILASIQYQSAFSNSELSTRVVATGLNTPWEILWGYDNWLWVTEREGRISRINPETGEIRLLATIHDVVDGSERGLMGLALHRDQNEITYVYAVYTYLSQGSTFVRLQRYVYDGEKLVEPHTLLEGIPGAGIHVGSRLLIDEENKLLMTTGDAGIQDLAQNIQSLNGKILRMNLDGSIPEDNPIPNSYVWSWGHRNPQGLCKGNGILYSSEHGPSTDDEINIIMKGRNYGWPNVHGYCDKPAEMSFCAENNVVEPIISLTPNSTLAVCGLAYYNSDLLPEWKNSLLLVNLKTAKLVNIKLDESGTKVLGTQDYFAGAYGRLRDVCVSPDGRIFIATSNRDGRGSPRADDDKIIEIKPISTDIKNEQDIDKSSFFAYPNPSLGYVTFHIPFGTNPSAIKIYDLLGRNINTLEINDNSKIFAWNRLSSTGEYSLSGIYRAVFTAQNMIKEFRIVLL